MAIYRKGTASVDAAGKMTGTGTEWMQALSLIRVGATVILLSGSKPVLGSIAEIISDTEMNLIGTDGQTAVSGEYVILLSDSLTVDGLAQDIAETLRYYQGKESAIDGLIDSIEAYLKRAEDSATASEASSQASAASAADSARQVGLASEQVSLAADQVSAAKTQADSAASSAASSQQSASAAKTSETNAGQKAADSAASASASKTSETNAGQKATDAAASASAAKNSEINAANTLSGAVKKSGDTMTGGLTIAESAGDSMILGNGRIELSAATPFIDFHYGKSPSDYTARIMHTEAQAIEVSAGTGSISLRINGGMRVGGANYSGGINLYRGNGDANALWGFNCSDGNLNIVRGSAAGSLMALGDSLLDQVRGVRGKQGSAGVYQPNSWQFYWSSSSQLEAWVDNVKIGNVTTSSTSDKELKKDITYREDASKALAEVLEWRPADFKMKARGIIPETADQLGFIANDLVKVSPECVSGKGLPDDYDIDSDPNNGTAYYLNHIPMIAKLTQAIQAQQKIIESLSAEIEELKSK